MTDTAALRALLAAATQGPWKGDRWLHPYGYGYFHKGKPRKDANDEWEIVNRGITKHDAALIVAAVNALPALLDEIEALRAALQAIRAFAAHYPTCRFVRTMTGKEAENQPCDCGFDDALAEATPDGGME